MTTTSVKTLLLLTSSLLLIAGAFASEAPKKDSEFPGHGTPPSPTANIPEPNPLIAVGLGSLAILVFAMRRK